MGFKDLDRYNEAMIAKQIWRLQIDKNSLMFKVFSTKYFPTDSVFEAKSKKGCSVKLQRFKVDKRDMLLGVSSPTP